MKRIISFFEIKMGERFFKKRKAFKLFNFTFKSVFLANEFDKFKDTKIIIKICII